MFVWCDGGVVGWLWALDAVILMCDILFLFYGVKGKQKLKRRIFKRIIQKKERKNKLKSNKDASALTISPYPTTKNENKGPYMKLIFGGVVTKFQFWQHGGC